MTALSSRLASFDGSAGAEVTPFDGALKQYIGNSTGAEPTLVCTLSLPQNSSTAAVLPVGRTHRPWGEESKPQVDWAELFRFS